MSLKDVWGATAVAVALIGYIPYFRDILTNKTKPHVFSWLLWGILAGIAFFGQVAGNAGSGAWVTGFTALLSLVVFAFALVNGTRDIVLADWLSLAGAGIALVLWFLTKGPILSIVIITAINALAFFPTFRKSFHNPREETATTYFLSGLKFVFSIVSLENISIVTMLFPLSLVVMNWLFVALLLIQRRRKCSLILVPDCGAG